MKMLKRYVYKVEVVDNYQQPEFYTFEDLEKNIVKDYERLASLRGYIKKDYYIADDVCEIGKTYLTSKGLTKIISLITTFEDTDYMSLYQYPREDWKYENL